MRDKRRTSRTEVQIPVEFTPWDPKHVAFGFVTDLTLTGAAVATEFPLPRGSHVVMRMWRPAWDEETVIAGVVRWARGGRMGVEIAPMAEATRDRLTEQIALARETGCPQADESRLRPATGIATLTRVLAMVSVSACGGLSTAGLLHATGADADAGPGLGSSALAGEGGLALESGDDASTGLVLSAPWSADAESPPLDSWADARGEAATPSPGGSADGSAEDRAAVDAGTPCGALEQCCSHLIIAPPLAAACYVTVQSDGAGGTCESTLATFHDSGLCP